MKPENIENHYHLFLETLLTKEYKSQLTIDAYRRDIAKLLIFWTTHYPKESFQSVLGRYHTKLLNSGLAVSSQARRCSSINTFLEYLYAQGLVAERILLPRPQYNYQIPALSSHQIIEKILFKRAVEDFPGEFPARERAIISILYGSGITCHEVTTLQLNHIIWESNTIKVHKLGRAPRSIVVNKDILENVQYYIQYERIPVVNQNEFIFINSRKEPLTSRTIQRACNSVSKTFKIKPAVTPHSLRHMHALQMIQKGTSLEEIGTRLGLYTKASIEKYLGAM